MLHHVATCLLSVFNLCQKKCKCTQQKSLVGVDLTAHTSGDTEADSSSGSRSLAKQVMGAVFTMAESLRFCEFVFCWVFRALVHWFVW